PGMERGRRPVPHGRGTLDRRPRFVGGTWPDTYRLENPVAVQVKEQLWSAIRPLLQSLHGQ
ncbi:MAG: hypothetical protein ACXVAT_15015, partial [Isosphaeraceae bacterium]